MDPTRDQWLEAIIKAMQVEIYNERIAREAATREARKELAENYMTRDQLAGTYVSKESVVIQRRERREWPLILAALLSGVAATADLLARAFGH